MRSILGGPRILDRRFVPADTMGATETNLSFTGARHPRQRDGERGETGRTKAAFRRETRSRSAPVGRLTHPRSR
jgi:hypothetical protein